MTPDISLLMCNYNNAPFIKKAIDSVLAQTYSNFELVLLDDRSTDNSLEIIRQLNDPRISFYQHEVNKGYGQSMFDAIGHAKSDLVGIIDPDDALTPDAVEVMINRLKEKPELIGAYSQLFICNADLQPVEVGKMTRKIPADKSFLEVGRMAMTHFFVFKKKKFIELGSVDRTLRNALDQDWYYKVEETGPVDFVEKPLYYYRVSPTGLSQGVKKSYLTARDHQIVRKNAVKRRGITGFKKYRILNTSKVDELYKKFEYLKSEKSKGWIFPLLGCFVRNPKVTVQALLEKLKK